MNPVNVDLCWIFVDKLSAMKMNFHAHIEANFRTSKLKVLQWKNISISLNQTSLLCLKQIRLLPTWLLTFIINALLFLDQKMRKCFDMANISLLN